MRATGTQNVLVARTYVVVMRTCVSPGAQSKPKGAKFNIRSNAHAQKAVNMETGSHLELHLSAECCLHG